MLQFESLIENNLAQYFDLKLRADQKITSMCSTGPGTGIPLN